MNDDPELDPASTAGPAGAARPGGLPSRLAILLAGGAALGLLVNLVHPRAVRFASFAPPRVCAPVPGASTRAPPHRPPSSLLSLAQVASLCGDPRAMVADARSAERFAEGHVAGAIHLPCASSRMAASAALDRLAGKETLVVYGDSTEEALPVAEELRRRGDRPGSARRGAGRRLSRLESGRARLLLGAVRGLWRSPMTPARISMRRCGRVAAARWGWAASWLVAGLLKLRDPSGFAVEIANYQLLPALAAYPAAILPATELVLGLGLIVAPAPWRRAATVGVAILFLLFTVAVMSAYVARHQHHLRLLRRRRRRDWSR